MMPGAALLLVALQLRAGTEQSGARSVSAGDSVRVVRSARSAQSSFEGFRRTRLPLGYDSHHPCDVRIGRYCFWREEESDEKEPKESPEITKRRDELIRTLDSAAVALPGDRWLAGQRVRYLVEAGRTDDAIRAASEDCSAEANWCASLVGYAAHVGGRFALADSAFNVALAAMSEADRCRWIDISRLLESDLERRFHDLDCAGRSSLAQRIFWLGAPLYSVAATDLRTEHFARLTRSRLAEHAATIDGNSWADDQRELVLRYGWPRWYSRSTPPVGSMTQPSITGHDGGRTYHFFPSLRAVDSMHAIGSDDWRLDDRFARTGYAPSFAKTIHDLPSQIALFRRGDSTLAVAAWDARRDTTLLGRSLNAALVLASPTDGQTLARIDSAKTTGRIAVGGRIQSGVVSLELLAKDDRRAARVRVGIPERATTRVALSDLLLYAANGTPAYELDAVRDSALASAVIPMSRAIGVYWETYGLRPTGEPVRFTLTVEQVGVGWMRRAAEALRFADPTTALRLQWEEVPEQRHGVAGRGVRVDLSRLRSGKYRVELSIAPRGEPAAVSSRDIEIR
ncbi:MAG TPA: hypothetical protein VIP11_12120 [Gemmatimonadaceae bacterium]